MNKVKAIRMMLGISQQALGEGVGCTQGNIGHYERGQQLPPDMAKRLIDFACSRGLSITYDHVYGDAQLAPLPELADASTTDPTASEVGHD